MRPIDRFVLKLYPPTWRERYGDELATLLQDSESRFRGTFDLFKGAMKMQLTLPSFPKLAVALSIAGALAGFGASFVVTPRYVSHALVSMLQNVDRSDSSVTPRHLSAEFSQMRTQIESRTSLSSIIHDPRLDLYKKEQASIPLEDIIEQMRNDITIQASPAEGDLTYLSFDISFAYFDRIKGSQTVQTLIVRFEEMNRIRQQTSAYVKRRRTYDEVDSMEARLLAIEKKLGIPHRPELPDYTSPVDLPITMNVVDPPSLPIDPVYPDRAHFMETGLGAGFVSALVIAVFRRKMPVIPYPAQTA